MNIKNFFSINWLLLTLSLNACTPLHHIYRVDVHTQSAHYLNPDINNDASPVMLTIDELENKLLFEEANFFELSSNAMAALKDSLVDQHTIVVRPASQGSFSFDISKQTRYLGIVVSYRNISFSEWKKIIPVDFRKTKRIDIFLSANSFTACIR